MRPLIPNLPIRRTSGRVLSGLVAVAAAVLLTSVIASAPASAATPGPGWMLDTFAQPTNFAPGDSSGDDTYVVTATNARQQP